MPALEGSNLDASAKFTSREYYDLSMLESVPRFAKIAIPLLTILNLLLLVWIYEEYLHNRFLRIYDRFLGNRLDGSVHETGGL